MLAQRKKRTEDCMELGGVCRDPKDILNQPYIKLPTLPEIWISNRRIRDETLPGHLMPPGSQKISFAGDGVTRGFFGIFFSFNLSFFIFF